MARCHTGIAPGAPVSAPPRMATGWSFSNWLAHRAEVAGWPSVAQVTILMGWPPIPSRYWFAYEAAACSASETSGNVTGPDSRFSRPNTTGEPLAGCAGPRLAVVGAPCAPADDCVPADGSQADPVHGGHAAVGHAQVLDHEQVVHPGAPGSVTEIPGGHTFTE